MGAEVRELHLTVPLSEADVRQLRAGDIVYLSGPVFTARGKAPKSGLQPSDLITNEFLDKSLKL